MKYTLILLFLLFAGCQNDQSFDLKSIREYQYPYDQLKEKKTFIYQIVHGEQIITSTLEVVERYGQKLVISTDKNDFFMLDSIVYLLDEHPKMMESYGYKYDSLNNFIGLHKRDIKVDRYFDNGTLYGGRKTLEKSEWSKNLKIERETIEKFKNDTVLQWKSKDIPSLFFEFERKVKLRYRHKPFQRKSSSVLGYKIYGRGYGLMKFGGTWDNKLIEWELIEIK